MNTIAIASCQQLPSFEEDDRFLYQALKQEGIHFNVIPWDADVRWDAYDMCLIRTTWDYVPRWTDFVRWIEHVSTQTLLLNPPETLRWNVDKHYLRELSERGVPIAPTLWITQHADVASLIEQQQWKRAFFKPTIGACASNTMRFTRDELPQAQDFLEEQLKRHTMMLQPYISTVETQGEYSAIFFADQCTHCVQKIPPKGDYRVQDDFGATDQLIPHLPELLTLAEHTLSETPHPWLYARVDALCMADNTWVLNELELIEPSLFFRHAPQAASVLVQALKEHFARS